MTIFEMLALVQNIFYNVKNTMVPLSSIQSQILIIIYRSDINKEVFILTFTKPIPYRTVQSCAMIGASKFFLSKTNSQKVATTQIVYKHGLLIIHQFLKNVCISPASPTPTYSKMKYNKPRQGYLISRGLNDVRT